MPRHGGGGGGGGRRRSAPTRRSLVGLLLRLGSVLLLAALFSFVYQQQEVIEGMTGVSSATANGVLITQFTLVLLGLVTFFAIIGWVVYNYSGGYEHDVAYGAEHYGKIKEGAKEAYNAKDEVKNEFKKLKTMRKEFSNFSGGEGSEGASDFNISKIVNRSSSSSSNP